jgi:hypothetical protein
MKTRGGLAAELWSLCSAGRRDQLSKEMPVDSGVLVALADRGLAPAASSVRDALNAFTISSVVRSSFGEYMRGEAEVVLALRRCGGSLS